MYTIHIQQQTSLAYHIYDKKMKRLSPSILLTAHPDDRISVFLTS